MTLEIDGAIPKFPAGDTKILPFDVDDEDGSDFSIDGADIVWKLQDTRTRKDKLTLSDVGVSIQNRDNQNGKFEIKLEKEATADLGETDYREILQITDANGNRTTWVGEIVLTDDG